MREFFVIYGESGFIAQGSGPEGSGGMQERGDRKVLPISRQTASFPLTLETLKTEALSFLPQKASDIEKSETIDELLSTLYKD